ncbi:MAG: RDD family protein [Mycobacterium sp.]
MTSGNYDPNYPQDSYPQPGGYGPPGAGGVPGDVGIRFGARVIDGIIISVIASILGFLLLGNYFMYGGGLLSGVLLFVYFVAMEVTQGWTLGKKILGLSVHGPVGAPRPTLQQSAIRNSFMLLGVIPFVGWILAIAAYIYIAVTISNSPTKQGKHDELAGGTQVVKG